VLWEASERLCSKRLRPLIPVLLPALERHGRLGLDDTLRSKLLTVSPATMDRLFGKLRTDDGADRYCHGLDRMRSGPHA
jgi:hypothetical protein